MKSLPLVAVVGFLGLVSQSCCMFKDCGGAQVSNNKTLFGDRFFGGSKGEKPNFSASEDKTTLFGGNKSSVANSKNYFGGNDGIEDYASSKVTTQTNGGKFIGLVPTMKKLAE